MSETTNPSLATRQNRALARIKRDQRVRRLTRKVRNLMPWLEDSDGPAVKAWAELEVLAAIAYANLREAGILTPDGEPRAMLDSYQRLRKAQLAFERELGMTPSARMTLKASGKRTLDLVGAMDAEVVEDDGAGS